MEEFSTLVCYGVAGMISLAILRLGKIFFNGG